MALKIGREGDRNGAAGATSDQGALPPLADPTPPTGPAEPAGPDRIAPVAPGEPRHRRRPGSRIMLVLSGALSLAVLATSVAGWVVLTVYDRNISRADIGLPHTDVRRPPAVPAGTENWLLVGSDVRTGSDAAKVGGARSDTMMIAHLDADGRTTIVSVPRDLYLPIPAYTDADGKRHRARHDRVNSAFNSGGPALLVATLEQLTGIRLDHYAEVDFGGFQRMTTAIGGVDVCLTPSPYVEPLVLDNGRRVRATNLNDPSSGFVGHPGTNHLVGAQALAFVRQRHGFIDGDLSRIHRQQAFLAAVFRKVTSNDVLLSPAKLTSFLDALTHSTVLDRGTDLADLRRLADRLRGMDAGAVTFATVPVTSQVSYPAFYFHYDPAAVRDFFARIMGGTTSTPTAPTTPGTGSGGSLDVPGVTPSASPADPSATAGSTSGPTASLTSGTGTMDGTTPPSMATDTSADKGSTSGGGAGEPGLASPPQASAISPAPTDPAVPGSVSSSTVSPTAVPTTTALAACIN
ncbi:putative transcriptional regulator [Frankia canadensis]|uniref:Putative transcriptional regulator n=1 Tax=Frankia canadensis TaxID=1836972 RepID=A0A2I2KMI0_9ACTN|nr:LCP family protein [Frankia canadensis]SNQ46875.1 putative transcriptional regulator [Frankia canadensis]SOU54165.1 putative transcriptional regulator [Frankia canadensis]